MNKPLGPKLPYSGSQASPTPFPSLSACSLLATTGQLSSSSGTSSSSVSGSSWQASPTPSPSASACSGLDVAGQLSTLSRTPSSSPSPSSGSAGGTSSAGGSSASPIAMWALTSPSLSGYLYIATSSTVPSSQSVRPPPLSLTPTRLGSDSVLTVSG